MMFYLFDLFMALIVLLGAFVVVVYPVWAYYAGFSHEGLMFLGVAMVFILWIVGVLYYYTDTTYKSDDSEATNCNYGDINERI